MNKYQGFEFQNTGDPFYSEFWDSRARELKEDDPDDEIEPIDDELDIAFEDDEDEY